MVKQYQNKELENKFNEEVTKDYYKYTLDRIKKFRTANMQVSLFSEILELKKTDKVLDIGCSGGIYEVFFEKKGWQGFTGIDLSKVCIDGANKIKKKFKLKSNFKLGDAENLPFKDNSFDKVLFFAILHHFPEKGMIHVLSEIKRVLKPGGILLLSEPNFWNKRHFSFKEIKPGTRGSFNERPHNPFYYKRVSKKVFPKTKIYGFLTIPNYKYIWLEKIFMRTFIAKCFSYRTILKCVKS